MKTVAMIVIWLLVGCVADEGARRSPCDRACSALAAVGCAEGNATHNGHTCAEVCKAAEAFPDMSLPTECLAKVKTKSEAKACGVTCW